MLAAGPWQAIPKDRGRRYYYARHRVYMHSFLTGWPLTDHINGDGLDNRRSNLRPATPAQNLANSHLSKRSTSGYKGVSRFTGRGRRQWRAYIAIDGRQRDLGTFVDVKEAARAYDAAALAEWGEYARLNFPGEAVTP